VTKFIILLIINPIFTVNPIGLTNPNPPKQLQLKYKNSHFIADDMYAMSEKAVVFDWLKNKILTVRYATGCDKYTVP
jgi:hypothetical protein